MTPEEFADKIEQLYWKFDRREDLIKLILSAKIQWEGEAYNEGYLENYDPDEDNKKS
jgi:hypothetical protein